MEKLEQKQTKISIKILFFLVFASYLFFIFETFQTTYSEYISIKTEVQDIQNQKEVLIDKINKLQDDINALDNPSLLEDVLREHGYGKKGEVLYIYDNPEPVKPIDEIFSNNNEISFPEKFINFISGKDG